MVKLEEQKFICIDCETTGLDPEKDRIIELAVVKFDLFNVYEKFETLVDPECRIPDESIAIHHITQKMISGKPKIQEVLAEFLKYVGNDIIVGHGVEFDIDIIHQSAKREKIPCDIKKNRSINTLRLARIYGESPVNSLESLRKHFHIESEEAHRAMGDVIVNIEVFKHLAKPYPTLEKMFEALSKPAFLKDMPLGKHKGRPLKEIPLEYLQWAANKDFDMDLLYSIRLELKRRRQGTQFSQAGNPFVDLK